MIVLASYLVTCHQSFFFFFFHNKPLDRKLVPQAIVYSQDQKPEQKHTTKTFSGFITIESTSFLKRISLKMLTVFER